MNCKTTFPNGDPCPNNASPAFGGLCGPCEWTQTGKRMLSDADLALASLAGDVEIVPE